MMTSLKFKLSLLMIALICGIGRGSDCIAAQVQSESNSWELNASQLQAVGLHLPSYMPTITDLHNYQKNLPVHQELDIEWAPRTGYDHTVPREQVDEGSLKHDFQLIGRKQHVKGGAFTNNLTLGDLEVIAVAITMGGEVRGFASGPSLLMRGEAIAVGDHMPEPRDYIGWKGAFHVSLPEDPQIAKISLLLVHPDKDKFRLEQVGTVDLTTLVAPK